MSLTLSDRRAKEAKDCSIRTAHSFPIYTFFAFFVIDNSFSQNCPPMVDVALRLWKWWNGPVPCRTCEGRRVVELERQLALLQNERRLSLGDAWTRNTVIVDIERGNQATEGDGIELENP